MLQRTQVLLFGFALELHLCFCGFGSLVCSHLAVTPEYARGRLWQTDAGRRRRVRRSFRDGLTTGRHRATGFQE